MLILGIEGSANKLGVGILRGNEILSNLRRTYSPPNGEGFIPTKVSEHHRSHILDLITESLAACKLSINDIDIFAYTKGPGIQQCLVVVATVVRTLGLLYNKPVIPVNHCIAHIEMGRLVTNAQNPVILYASGGNTQILAYSEKHYRIFGETLDIAVGNCLDKIARDLKLDNFPSPGFSIEKKAKCGSNYIPLPYSVKGMDMSFSGIASTVKKISKGNLTEEYVVDLCYSIQETIFSMLVEGTERCMSLVGSKEVLIVGGVGCNLRLQGMMEVMAKSRGGSLYAMDERYCIDNGAMIAYTGYLMHKAGMKFNMTDCYVTQRFRTDTVAAEWR